VFLFGHLGIGLGLAWILSGRSAARFDYRLVLFGAILPDLIDKPLGIALGLDTRIWGHTLLFLFALLAVGLAPGSRASRFVGFGVATHLLLDQIWRQPDVAVYPAYGWMFPPAPFDAGFWWEGLLHNPYIQAGEVLGLIILVTFAWAHGLRSWTSLKEFLRRGTLPRPS